MEDLNFTFLVAERDMTLRNAQVESIKEMGFTKVMSAATGTQAWSMLKRTGADFIVCGWNLPEISGLTLLKIVRADKQYLTVPFLMVAELVTKGQVVEAGQAGVTDIICRPITPQRFKEKLESLLQWARDPERQEAESAYQKGLKLMEQGKWEEALASFRRILTIYENAEIYYNMGYINTVLERYDEAIVCFRKATEIDEAFARAYQKIGECYAAMGEQVQAENYLQRAADIFLEKESDPDSAEQVLKEILKVNPNTINVFNTLGIIYRRQARYEEAIHQYLRALRVSPQDENIFYNLGRCYYDLGDDPQAAKVLKRAVEVSPKFEEAQKLLKAVELRQASRVES